ncbi:Alpha/beta hydrolase protein [Tribonema minus]|uniref:Alpha/beta hydrolase protein n=1 Tax=Tribonema minus TaxID=303371 RepID=A0A835ZB94_9STRA|nr:Alpha/beta hydrolase protein [Tribonema minus]
MSASGTAAAVDVTTFRTWTQTSPQAAAESFQPAEFQCARWAFNPHVHTIFGSGEVAKRVFRKDGPAVDYRRERLDTPDGDFIDVDFYDGGANSDGGEGAAAAGGGKIAVLTHGLESTSTAPLTARMALAFAAKGYRVAVLCFRSCSGEDNRTLGAYHMGFTDDLGFLVETLRKRHPSDPIFLSGFSLGGNVISKYLGEIGSRAQELGIIGASVSCVPFDAVGCQEQIDSGFNRRVYSGNFLKSLKPKIARKFADPALAEQAKKVLDLEAILACSSIGEFDDLYIAKVYGFDSATDYYIKNQSGPFLKKVTVPLLAIQARDDPFMRADTLPTQETCEGAPIKLAYYDKGGHCAFISRDRADRENNGWLPLQLARFAEHLETAHAS